MRKDKAKDKTHEHVPNGDAKQTKRAPNDDERHRLRGNHGVEFDDGPRAEGLNVGIRSFHIRSTVSKGAPSHGRPRPRAQWRKARQDPGTRTMTNRE